MRTKLFCLILLLIPSLLWSQVMRERRVYYLDCSYSMVQLGIKDKVCDNLIKAIERVEDQTTELYVIRFAYNSDKDAVLNPIIANATEQGKQKLIKAIREISWNKNTMTYHKDPIEDFYGNNRILKDGLTYMFLMTDGKDEWPDPARFINDLKEWGEKYGEKNVYGFYVMLDEVARNPEVEEIVDQQPHFWNVSSADVNIRITRAEDKAVFNIRTDKYVDIPIIGPTDGYQITASSSNPNYRIKDSEITNGKLRLFIEGKKAEAELPESEIVKVELSIDKNPGKFYFWVTDVIKVKCNNKREPAITSYTIK